MVSISISTSAILLGLASRGFAETTTSLEHDKFATGSQATKTEPSYATITPAPTGPHPWYFEELSEKFIRDAVAIRSKDVPADVASSVAKHLIDVGISPPQYTTLASQALQMWVDDGYYPNATSLYNYATQASSAYNEIHNNLEYWALVNYVQTTAATVFDVARLQHTAVPHALNDTAASIASRNRAYITSVYSSLEADPSGHAAISILNDVATSYQRDFSPNNQYTGSVTENLLSWVFNVV